MEKNRSPVKPKKDRKIFEKTSKKTKAINVRPGQWRGGIRLQHSTIYCTLMFESSVIV